MGRKYGQLPPTLRRLPVRQGKPPHVAIRYPCLQTEETAPPHLREQLLEWCAGLEGVTLRPTELNVPGIALVLDEHLAKGQPEAFIRGHEFAIVREEGSVHLTLRPEWGQKVLDKGWGTVHPLVRYMAGALPPQNIIVYAPRDERELRVVWKVVQAGHAFACGLVEGRPLPDSAW